MQCVAFDSHKQYTWALVEDEKGKILRDGKIPHTSVQDLATSLLPTATLTGAWGNWMWNAFVGVI